MPATWRPVWLSMSLVLWASVANACPFCDATEPTWRQSSLESAGAAVARVIEVDAPTQPEAIVSLAKVRLEVVEALHFAEGVPAVKSFSLEVVDAPAIGSLWLCTGVGAPELSWSPLVELTAERAAYFAKARQQDAADPERLAFFAQHLEHADPELATDAYGEFAAASFAEVQAARQHYCRDKLWNWITSETTPENRRGLYYTLLGVCGDAEDAARLKKMLAESTQRPPGGFDALVACYVTLCGEAGLREIEAQFLSQEASPRDVSAVVMALRFHGEERHVLERTRLAKAFARLVDRPSLAVQVIPDLARWEHWDALPALVKLYREAPPEDAWIRIPIVSYVRACPLPEAKTALEELAKLDPKAVEQASALALFGARLQTSRRETSESDETSDR